MKGAGMSNMLTMDHGMMRMNPDIMHQGMKREFFLDRIESLGLTPDQVSKLKTIRTDCRKENIRNAAEVQILRLDLEELLSNSDWALKATEPLIRKIKNLEGNMLVRHLQAIAEARNVLSSEQLQKTISGGENEALEDLF
jgi:Spy/CpxP family protein refolding chaperone